MNALVHNQRRSLLLCVFLFAVVSAGAQIKANFTATSRTGCSPLVVYFSDSSTGQPTHWKWDLGNGVTSFLRNPSATYFNPGTYRVKLIASNADATDSVVKTDYITVYASPNVRFSTDRSTGCYPLQVHFSDSSTAGSGNISSWQWDFGDGTLSTEQHPVHTYTTAGTFTVTLRVLNSFGCVKTFTRPAAIHTADGVQTAFTQTNAGVCPAPVTIQFTNQSKGSGPLFYHWNFGDSSTSTALNPSHTYTSNGSFTVRLTVTNTEGCTDSLTKKDVVKPGSAKADFNLPAKACINSSVSVTSTSTATPASVQWLFGDGTSSTGTTVVKQYTKAGVYTVRLIAVFENCADTVEKQITIEDKPGAGFTANKQLFCSLPAKVQFTPLQQGNNLRYQWNFGDGTTSTTANPTHEYKKEDNYSVSLVVTNESGCNSSLTQKDFIKIQKPNLTVAGLQKTGCTPLAISPVASVSGGQTITNYHWSFGDGTSSTSATPSHTYTKTGNYTVRLVITTAGGCTDSITYIDAVRAGEKPKAAYSHQPPITCSFDKVYFTDNSEGNVDQWFWNFDDGSFSTEQSPTHQFGDTGWHHVTLIVYNNTCPDTIVKKNAVYVKPPISSFLAANDCNNRYTKQFTDRSRGPLTWFWDFGDGTTSTEQHPKHTYAQTGNYAVRLTVTNGDCTHFSIQTVLVIDEKALFSTPDTILCRNGNASFAAQNVNGSKIASWKWNFGDGSSSNQVFKTEHRYTKTGRYVATLTLTDLLGCVSTFSKPITVFGPTADFKPMASAVCFTGNNVGFLESSTTDGIHPIQKRIWNYGDNVIDSTAAKPFAHHYSAAGTYPVELTVVDAFGCRDTKKLPAAIIIARPEASFVVSDTLTCTGKNISFTSTSKGISPLFQWSFGDGTFSGDSQPVHAYKATGLYDITLRVTDQYGCKDSINKPAHISITYPKAKFSVSDSVGTCPPLLVHFTNESSDYQSVRWDFGDGSRSLSDSPSHFYAIPGTYYAMLIVTGPGGCTDTATKKIVIKGPEGTFSYGPLTGCQPMTVNFTASVKNSTSLIWDFSDGNTVASKDPTISYTYRTAGEFVPKIILTDSGGCTIPIFGKDTIHIKGVTPLFDLSPSHFCADGRVQFTNKTVSNDLVTGYQWRFGDGATSTETNPTHHYTKAGLYSVELTATTQSGCRDTIKLTDTVKVFANPVVEIKGDSAACAPATLQFSGKVISGQTSPLQWQWNLGNGQMSNTQNPAPQVYPEGSFTISVTVTDANGCGNTATKKLSSYPTPQIYAGADQWICRGSFAQLKATGATNYQWQQASTLSCSDCDSPLAAPADSTLYTVTGANSFGCTSTDSIMVRVHQPFTLQVEKGDTICVGKTIRLAAVGADRYTWTPSLNVKNPSAGLTTATPQTSTLYTVVAKDNVNCFTDTASVYIQVWPIPTIKTETAFTLSAGSEVVLKPTYSPDVSIWQWTNAQTLSCSTCPSPVAKPKAETVYTVTAKNAGGCAAKESITIRMICNNGNLFIPNTFSPNADGTNDQFYPRGTGISSIKSLKIFNRWGEMVFSRENFGANDAAQGWDGRYKGQLLPSDVYIYTCDVVCTNNEVLSYKGDISLLR